MNHFSEEEKQRVMNWVFRAIQSNLEDSEPELWVFCYDRIREIAHRRGIKHDGSEEQILLIKVFDKLYHRKKMLDFRGNSFGQFYNWLRRIILDLRRDVPKKDRQEVYIDFWDSIADPRSHSPESIVINQEFWDIALSLLNPLEKIIVTLRFKEDYKPTEIANFLKKTPNFIRVTIHRSLKRIKDYLNSGSATDHDIFLPTSKKMGDMTA